MIFRIYHPEVFQGSLKKKRYFEGWYFKHVTRDNSRTLSVIPGISLSGDDSHAFIQIMDGLTGLSNYTRFPLREFGWDKKSLSLQIGSSEFTLDHLILNVKDDNLRVTGRIDYQKMVKYPGNLISPGIMGWYSFVPFMECNHGIVSVTHELSGRISINRNSVDFDSGTGYIEKDWGTSFPEAWIWIQSNSFPEPDTSFSFSIAKIPWLGSFFVGFIAYLYFNNRFYLFSTYNRSLVSLVSRDKDSIGLIVRNKRNTLKIRVFKKSFGDLVAPVAGVMSRRIKESMDSEVHLEFYNKLNHLEYESTGKCAGLEVIEKIFDYIK